MGGYGLNPTGSCGRGIIGREPVGLPNGLMMVALGATSALGTAPVVIGSPVGFGGNVAWIEGVVGGAVTPVYVMPGCSIGNIPGTDVPTGCELSS